jgi:uncharacterized protein
MKITTRDIADQPIELQVDCPASEIDLSDSSYKFDRKVTGTVTFTQVEDQSVVARGRLATSAETQCVRCLEPIRVDLEVRLVAIYQHDPDLLKPDAQFFGGDEEMQAYYDGESIDPAPQMREALLLEVPPLPVCRKDCPGLCPRCGANLNTGKCACPTDAAGDKTWKQALKQLKLDT